MVLAKTSIIPYYISCSNESNSGVEKNSPSVISKASQSFLIVTVPGFWLSPFNMLLMVACGTAERFASPFGVIPRSLQRPFIRLAILMKCDVDRLQGKEVFPEQELAVYLERYDRLVDEGLAANPIPERAPGKRGRRAKGKFRCLLERFRDFKDDILRFARDWRVPYTNNTAERAICCARVKEKVSGCFRTKSGTDDFARVLSFTSSAALHGVSSFDAIVAAFRGHAVRVLVGVD